MTSTTGEETYYSAVYTVFLGGRDYYKNLTFACREDYLRWQHRVDEIKETIRCINEAHDHDPRRRLQSWVLLVTNFVADFGGHKVPLDIRNVMHDVQRHLSLALMDFGPDVCGTFDIENRSFPARP